MCYAKDMKCKYCSKEYQSQRKSSQFCSDKCRVYNSRNKETPALPKTVKEIRKVIEFDGLCEHQSMKGLCKYGCK